MSPLVDPAAVIARGRALAAELMTETFDVYTTTRTLNTATGLFTETPVTVHSGVLGQIKFPSNEVHEADQGGQSAAVQDIVIKTAVGAAPNTKVDHLWKCTASTADASLVNRVFRTKGLPKGGRVTTHRYPVEAVS